MKKKNNLKITLLSSIISGAIYSPLAFSDDIEIYTGSKDTESIVNIMFMLDTSGSMSYGVSGTNQTRMEQAQDALKTVISELPGDMRVGLGRYNTPAGSILLPARRLDEIIEQDIIKQPTDNYSDAHEEDGRSENTIVYNDELLFEPTTYSISDIIYHENEDAEECVGGSNFLYTSQYAGIPFDQTYCREVNAFLFRNLSIPQNARILSAQIELTAQSVGNAERDVRIHLENDDDPRQYDSSNRIENRNYYNDSVYWNIPYTNSNQKVYSPDLSSIVQTLVDRSDWTNGNNGLNFRFESLIYDHNDWWRNPSVYYTSSSSTDSYKPKLNITYSTGSSHGNIVGIKFDNLQIASAASVDKGELKLIASRNNGSGTLKIALENNINPSDYEENVNNISDRQMTTQYLELPFTNWNSGEARFFDVASLIQDRVNHSDWCGGKDINFLITSNQAQGVYAKDHSTANSPELALKYSGGTDTSCLSYDRVIQVDAHEDDSQEDSKNNKNYPYKSKITMKKNGGLGGFIFRNVDIPSDAVILDAYLQVTAMGGNESDETYPVGLYVVKPDEYPIEGYKSNKRHLSEDRGGFYARKLWNLRDLSKNKVFYSPSIKTEISSLIKTLDYKNASEKSIEVILENENDDESLYLFSYDDNPGKAAKLIIKYEGSALSHQQTSMSKMNVSVDGKTTIQAGSPLTVRQHLIEIIDQQPTDGSTPMDGSLYEAGLYFLGEPVDYGKSRNEYSKNGNTSEVDSGRISGPDTYENGTVIYPSGCSPSNLSSSKCRDIFISGDPTYISPMTDQVCETNNIILITDGEPTNYSDSRQKNMDGVTLENLIKGHTGVSCYDPWSCATAWVSYLYKNDFMPDKTGKSNVLTHIIGFSKLASEDKLRNLAGKGGGVFVTSNNTNELVNALNLVISSIMEIESTLATPGVAVNQNNRTEHLSNIYYSVFQPSLEKGWLGNLKKYKLSTEKETIVDKNDVNAVDEETGFFKEDTTSFWSTEPDGGVVEKGGAANKQTLSRNVLTYTGINDPREVYLNVSDHRVSTSNGNLTKSLFGLSDSDISNSEFDQLVNWLSGIDVFDENLDGSYSDARRLMGDPLHSRPILVSYGDKDIVFVSTNEGFLHATNAATGEEEFAFIPQELLINSYDRYRGGSGAHIYGLDSSWIAWRHDKNKDGKIVKSDGDFIYLYAGMRRGGETFYALDVTDVSNPKLKFIKHPEQSQFASMGQTWSEPVMGRIKLNGNDKVVLVFAGGYDLAYDNENYNALSDSVGSELYFVDAVTGDLIYKVSGTSGGGNLKIVGMEYSIASKPTILDFDGDGYIDHIYQSDMASQIIKISLNEDNTGVSNFATGKIIAKLGKSTGNVSLENTRMMYDSIAVSPIRQDGEKYISVVASTGYRAHPLDTVKEDVIVMIKDKEDYYAEGDQKIISTPYLMTDLADVTNTLSNNDAQKLIDSKAGYFIKLQEKDGSYIGEKGTGDPLIFDNQIFITTYVPNEIEGECVPVVGYSRGYEMNIATGSPTGDKNGDGVIDETDRYHDKVTTGIANGSKIIYTGDGNYLLTNTDVRKIGNGGSMGSNNKRWYIERTKNEE